MDVANKFTRRIIPGTETLFNSEVFPWTGASIDLWFTKGRYYSSAGTIAVTDELSDTRASIAYADTSTGTLTQFATNTLRITDLGLYVEGTNTNLFLQSQTFQTTWATFNVTVTADTTSAPDGTSTADTITESNDGSPADHYIDQSVTTTNGAYILSVYAKTNGRDILVDMSDGSTGDAAFWVNLTTGVATQYTIGSGVGSWTNISCSVQALANNWYRIILKATSGAGTSILTRFWTFNGTTNSYTGNGTSGIIIWGAQLENTANSSASSYIPTTTTSAARAADNVLTTGLLSSVLAAKEATLVADVKWAFPPLASDWYAVVADPIDVQSWYISPRPNLVNQTEARFGGVSQVATLGNGATWTNGAKCGFAWHVDSPTTDGFVRVFGGGGTVLEQFAAPTQLGFSSVSIGYNADPNRYYFGWYRRMTVWNRLLPNESLQLLTVP